MPDRALCSWAVSGRLADQDINTFLRNGPHYLVECQLVQAGAASSANAGFISNAGAVATGAGLVVFDTLGTPPLGAKMRRLIEEASGERVKVVVVSHYHADHFYGIQARPILESS